MLYIPLIIKVKYQSVHDGTIILPLTRINFFKHLEKIKFGSKGKNIYLDLCQS